MYCEGEQIYFHNILSSSIPKDDIYILVLGNNKVHFIDNSIVECSVPLITKLKKNLK